jgi:Xaa-Pro aminopeptidase
MKSYFDADYFSSNRKSLRNRLDSSSPIIITANSLLQRNSDIAYPFRQDSNFWYLTGITEPDFVLVMDGSEEYLIAPNRNDIRTIFDGGLDDGAASKRSGIKQILDTKTGWKQLGARLKQVNKVAIIAASPKYINSYEFYTNPARANLIKKLKQQKSGLDCLDLREHFAEMRMRKQPQELAAIRASVDITEKALKDLQPKLLNMKHEYEAEAFLTHIYRSQGVMHGYSPIVAGGKNACTLHYDENSAALKSGELLLIDTGAEAEYYSADITRTYMHGKATTRQLAVHAAVSEVQEYVLSYLKPGISLKESEQKSEQFMGKKLRELGLIKKIERKTVRRYFPHATSHFLGLDLHDAGDYEKPLEPDMVVTVEPGIYIPEEGIGIRIEDDILITRTGNINLSDTLPNLYRTII